MEHPIHQQITDLLRQHNCWFEEFTHEPVRTSEEAAKLRDGYTLCQGAKAIIVRAKIPNQGKKFVMLVMPGDQKFDTAKASHKIILNLAPVKKSVFDFNFSEGKTFINVANH